jgi:uncharacterized heparinase superfamily protein
LNDSHFIDTCERTYEDALMIFGEKAQSVFNEKKPSETRSRHFKSSGYIVLRNQNNYLFIESSKMGLADRGGHGHNDFGSFELSLVGEPIIVDSGCYSYTFDYLERNNFRSTSYHNTPVLNSEEINRFISPFHLWGLKHDARNLEHYLEENGDVDTAIISHDGYRRLKAALVLKRVFQLSKKEPKVVIIERISNLEGISEIKIPFHFHHGVSARIQDNKVLINTKNNCFQLSLDSEEEFKTKITPCKLAYDYSVYTKSSMLNVTIDCSKMRQLEFSSTFQRLSSQHL